MNKRGNVQQALIFVLFGVAFAAVAGIGILDNVKDDIETKTLERNFLARDIAMTINAIYAAPGEVTYTYEFPTPFTVDIVGNEVQVRKLEEARAQASYFFVGDTNVDPPEFTARSRKQDTEGLQLTFHKHLDRGRWRIDVTSATHE